MVSRKTRLKFFKSTQRAWRRCIRDALIHKLFIVSKNPFTHILYGYVAFNFCKKKNRFFDPKQRERSLKKSWSQLSIKAISKTSLLKVTTSISLIVGNFIRSMFSACFGLPAFSCLRSLSGWNKFTDLRAGLSAEVVHTWMHVSP